MNIAQVREQLRQCRTAITMRHMTQMSLSNTGSQSFKTHGMLLCMSNIRPLLYGAAWCRCCVPLTHRDALWLPWHIVAQLNNFLLPITTIKPIDILCSKRSSNYCSAHLRTQRDAHLLRHAPRDADGRHAPRLRHAHHAALRAADLKVRFW